MLRTQHVKTIRREEHAEGLTGDREEQSGSRCFGPLNFHVRRRSRPPGSTSTVLRSACLRGCCLGQIGSGRLEPRSAQDELVVDGADRISTRWTADELQQEGLPISRALRSA
jgi:hypothetical protein